MTSDFIKQIESTLGIVPETENLAQRTADIIDVIEALRAEVAMRVLYATHYRYSCTACNAEFVSWLDFEGATHDSCEVLNIDNEPAGYWVRLEAIHGD